ncbi:hypothetical protein BWQ96_09109 [Gracilariopsis chorda]|uniref:Uncharacterized protein n=1 Tax=Gracilariopsis chorda TaxID=448386 RepID=A0A2V3IGG4_9FLOR|nr:hypothetical protein BWQ96_09109 [Gracilariopsis chorda]|eukprot:PXF41167.1 hypothetical protein BWQ96_09109 [Gracilariopsis chorda]
MSGLKRKWEGTYPVLRTAQSGWLSNDFIKEAMQRDRKSTAEEAKKLAKKVDEEKIKAAEAYSTVQGSRVGQPLEEEADVVIHSRNAKLTQNALLNCAGDGTEQQPNHLATANDSQHSGPNAHAKISRGSEGVGTSMLVGTSFVTTKNRYVHQRGTITGSNHTEKRVFPTFADKGLQNSSPLVNIERSDDEEEAHSGMQAKRRLSVCKKQPRKAPPFSITLVHLLLFNPPPKPLKVTRTAIKFQSRSVRKRIPSQTYGIKTKFQLDQFRGTNMRNLLQTARILRYLTLNFSERRREINAREQDGKPVDHPSQKRKRTARLVPPGKLDRDLGSIRMVSNNYSFHTMALFLSSHRF